jgi:hypothetical protein
MGRAAPIMRVERQFEVWFKNATGHVPYPFQLRFACEPSLFQNPSPLDGEGRVRGRPKGGSD